MAVKSVTLDLKTLHHQMHSADQIVVYPVVAIVLSIPQNFVMMVTGSMETHVTDTAELKMITRLLPLMRLL